MILCYVPVEWQCMNCGTKNIKRRETSNGRCKNCGRSEK